MKESSVGRIYRMGRTATVVFCIVAVECLSAAAETIETALSPDSLYAVVSGYILETDYSHAETFLDEYSAAHPDEPAAFLFKAAVIQYQATDYEDYSREADVITLLNKVDRLTDNVDKNKDDLMNAYWHAASSGLRGSWMFAAGGGLVDGVLSGRSGAKEMETILAADSTFYDACLMIGSYRFWRGKMMDKVPLMTFSREEAEAAVAMVRRAIEKGRFSGPLSYTVLLEILLVHNPAEAVSVGEVLFERFPRCRLFLWQLGEAYKKTGRFEDAERIFSIIAASMGNDPFDNGAGQLRCWWKLAAAADERHLAEKCVYYSHKVVAFADDGIAVTLSLSRIEKARKLIDKYEKK